jgi:predicted ATPase
LRENSRFVVITGGPGSGKSTLLAALSAAGFAAMPEAGRAIIQDQVSIGGSALPWADRAAFAELMLSWEMRSYHEAEVAHVGTVMFDRGIPDVVGYLRLSGLPVPPHVLRAAETFSYSRQVFIAPPWPEIFTQDAEREQSVEEAEATYHALADAYGGLGYDLVPLPRVAVAERVGFVRAKLGSRRA